MQNLKQENFTHLSGKTFTGWEDAISDTEAAITRSRVRLRELKAALRVFVQRRDAGDPWPGTS